MAPLGADESAQPAADLAKWNSHMGKVPFVVGYENGKAEAQFSGKPMMLFFTTTWCGFCKKLAGESLVDADVVKELQLYVPVIVDGDTEKETAQKYGVQGFPHIVFETLAGKKLGTVGGYVPTAEFLGKVRGATKAAGPVKFTKAYVKLMKASAALKTAMEKEDYPKALEAIEDIEGVKHSGSDLTAALAEKARIEGVATERLEAARKQMDTDAPEAKTQLRAITREFKGLPAAEQAKELLKELG